MKLLVTGGAGFIGSNFVHYWVKNHPKDKVKVLDALTFAGNKENLEPIKKKIEFIEGDILDRKKVKEALKGVDAVVHFAAETHVDRSVLDPGIFWKTNVQGTQVLLEEADKAGIPRFHHVSTDEVYGELALDSNERFNDKTLYSPTPDNPYALSKAEADRVVLDFHKKSDMHVTISNCSNNYGPYQFPEKYVPILITNLIDNLKAPVHGDGKNVRDWIHTEDHSRAIETILEKGKSGETYLVGTENDRSNKEVAEHVVKVYGRDESWIRHVPDRHSNDRRYAIDPTKIYTELGWKPQMTRDNFDDGLKDTIKWYKKNKDWWKPLLDRTAPISNGEKEVFAHISLDREAGKAKFTFKHADNAEKPKRDLKLEQKMLEDTDKIKNTKEKLRTREWFKSSSKSVRNKLYSLAEDVRTQGFVEDLANRADDLNGVKQLKVLKISHAPKRYGIYGIACWFQVETKDGEKKAEGIYSWGMGPKSGAKLLVLIRHKGKITHLAMLKNEKFPIGAKVYDLAGGFPKLNESVYKLISRQLTDELGIQSGLNSKMTVGEIIGLGRVMPDAGMTNNHPFLYAVIIEVADKIFPPLNDGETYETKEGLVLWPTERLQELVNKSDDAYFLSALTRLTLGGVGNIELK